VVLPVGKGGVNIEPPDGNIYGTIIKVERDSGLNMIKYIIGFKITGLGRSPKRRNRKSIAEAAPFGSSSLKPWKQSLS
jgi:hypothetical protein